MKTLSMVRVIALGLGVVGASASFGGYAQTLALLWAAVDSGGERQLIGSADGTGLATSLETSATATGLTVLLPLLDTEDRGALSARDIYGGNDRAIHAASARYGADRVVTVALTGAQSGQAKAHWNVLGTPRRWVSTGENASIALSNGMRQAVQMLNAANPSSAAPPTARRIAPTAAPGPTTTTVMRRNVLQPGLATRSTVAQVAPVTPAQATQTTTPGAPAPIGASPIIGGGLGGGIPANAISGTAVTVTGVRTLSDYARTLDRLSGAAQGQRVLVVRVGPDRVRFDVQGGIGPGVLSNSLGFGGDLVPESSQGTDLTFRLLR